LAWLPGHLALVACGAAGLRLLPASNIAGQTLRCYGALSGADMGFGFFAPAVGSQMRAVFVLTDGTGHTWEDDLEAGHNHEVKLRIGALINQFPVADQEEFLRRDLAASWAGTLFARHPTAQQITVRVEAYDVPSRAEYRAGARPAWVHVSSYTCTREQPRPTNTERRVP
jgi:hypothetical protein